MAGTLMIVSPVHAGQEFGRIGLANCAINTSQPVGTSISISFVVFDRGTPVLNATAQRTLVIGSPCATGYVDATKNIISFMLASNRTVLSGQITLTGLHLCRAVPLQQEMLPSDLFGSSITGTHPLSASHQPVHRSHSTAGVRVCNQLCLRLCGPTFSFTVPFFW